MLDEVAQLYSAWLQTPINGVNDIAATIPQKTLAGLQLPSPPTVNIYNDVDDRSVAANLDPPQVPALVVWGDNDADVKKVGNYPIAKVVVACVAYITDDTADPLTAIRDCGLLLRASRISLFVRYNSVQNSKAYRTLNGITVLSVDSVGAYRITAAVGQRKMWGFLQVRSTVVETIT